MDYSQWKWWVNASNWGHLLMKTNLHLSWMINWNSSGNYRSLPVFQLLELVLNESVKILDFSKNRDWIESEEMNEFARILWKIVGERCKRLQKFIIPKELTYSSTLNSVIGKIRWFYIIQDGTLSSWSKCWLLLTFRKPGSK